MAAGRNTRPGATRWLTVLAMLAGLLALAAPAQAIGKPAGLAPSGPVASSTPTLTWGRVPGAKSYEVQVDDTPGFDTPLFSVTTTNTTAVPTAYLPNADLYWRVRTMSVSGAKSGWASEQFSIDPTAAPSPVSPIDGVALAQPDEPPLLTWAAVAGATGYEVEVDVDGDWVGSTTYSAPGTSFMVPTPQAAGTWSWRVRAQRSRDLVTLWSDPATYEVLPLADVQIDPDMTDGTPVQDVVLDWLPVPGAVKYELQVGLDQDFTIPVETKTVLGTRYSPTTTYNNDQFFWRVRAIDAAGAKMSWPSTPFEFQRSWPQRPTLTYPADQLAPSVGDAFYFQWTPVQHATRYQLNVGTDPNFSPSTYTTCTTAATTYTPGNGIGLSCMPGQGEVTYWRVRALDAPRNVEGIYSDIHRFVYDSGRVTQTAPVNGSTVSVPTLKWQAARDAEKYFVSLRDNTGSVVETATTYSLSWTVDGSKRLDPTKSPYTWAVQAVDYGGAKSPLSFSGYFTLAGEPATSGAAPLTPLTGVSGDASTLRAPALSWEPVSNAQYYKIQIGISGSGFFLNSATSPILSALYPYPAATDIGKYFLSPGSYDWRVVAYDENAAYLGTGPMDTFTIADLAPVAGQRIALDGQALDAGTTCAAALGTVVSEENICTEVPASPVLDWTPVPQAAFYMVYLANDRELTNRVFTGSTTSNSRWALTTAMAKEALADNQAGQAYYWYVRPCKAVSVCAKDPISVSKVATNAFRKISPRVELLSPTDTSVAADDITFDWTDYYETNQAVTYQGGAAPSPQTAQSYRIEISQVPTFSSTVDVREVDQSTYTPYDRTLPEGTLYWRVQAIDAEGNHLNWGQSRVLHQVSKQSGTVTLTAPVGGTAVGGSTPFQWQAKDFTASYALEVYKNNDTTFSTANRVFTATSKQSAYAWSKYLPASGSAYLWRVRWTDGGGKLGGWSAPGRFFVSPGVVTQTSPGSNALQPAAGPTFTWDPVPAAARYFLEARLVGTTRSAVRITTVAQAAAASTTFSDGVYEWRTTAYDPTGGVLAQSPWRRFRVDTTKPLVVKKTPLTTATRSANFVAKFNEKVRGVGGASMKLYVAGRTTKLSATVKLSSDGRTATLNPTANLVAGKTYTLKLTSAIKDTAGNTLAPVSWKVKAK